MSAMIQAAIALVAIGTLLVFAAFGFHHAASLPQPAPEHETMADRLNRGDDQR